MIGSSTWLSIYQLYRSLAQSGLAHMPDIADCAICHTDSLRHVHIDKGITLAFQLTAAEQCRKRLWHLKQAWLCLWHGGHL